MRRGEQIRQCTLDSRIGAGGMGEVWRAFHRGMRRSVAVKSIQLRDRTLQQRFEREAEAMALLSHPHIVPIYEGFVVGSTGYLVMGLIEGGSVASIGRVALPVVQQIAREILDALNYAHQRGVVHRDVKPSNILIDRNGHAHLTDFGIALVAGTPRITRLTQSGIAVGTPEYMSPEQIATPDDIDHRTDVYSFGCVLYELLAGQPPFGSRDGGTTDYELMRAHVQEAPVPIRRHNALIDRNTERVIARALAKDREQRFDGCGDMAHALLYENEGADRTRTELPLAHVLFSLQGRLTARQVWHGLAAVALLFALTALLAQASARIEGILLVGISLVAGGWGAIAIAVKRLRGLIRPG